MTAITQIKEDIVEIIDVEKVLAEIIEYDTSISEGVLDNDLSTEMVGRKVLIVDDSSTARMQVKGVLSQLGLEIIECLDGLEAFNLLKAWTEEGVNVAEDLLLMITDAEMPEMDGYKLTYEVRNDPRMKDLYITLNTSLSGSFNDAMVKKVGCDRFISKFQPDVLVEVAQTRLKQVLDKSA